MQVSLKSLAGKFAGRNGHRKLSRTRRKASRFAGVEQLEGRHMMAVVASFTNSQLSIIGDAANDTVAISTVDVGGVAQVMVNGQGVGAGVDASAVTSIFANLGGGTDSMNLSTLDLTKFIGLTDGSIEIRGGAGNDTLVGSPLADILKGEDGNDSLTGGPGTDQLIGGNGNDTLIGGAGDDTLDGGAGDDMYSFSGSTDLGSDTVVQAASGNLDTIGFGSLGGAIVVDISMTTPQVVRAGVLTLTLSDSAGIDNVQGTAYDDVILGNTGGNSLMGNGGNDYLWGRGGNDWLDGGAGNDTLYGGDGNDTLLGKGGNDSLYGHAGEDTLNGNEGNDYLSGDEGDDTYIVTNYGTKTMGAASGSDRIDVSGQTLTGTLDLSSTSVQTIAASLSVRFTAANAVAWVLGGAKNHQASVGEFIDGYYTVPGIPGTTTMLEFEYGGAIAAYSNKVYVYDASDDPEHPDGTYLFTGHAQGQSPKPMTFPAGTRLGFYIEQDGDPGVRFYSDDYKNNNDLSAPRNHVDADALAPGKIQLSWEDLYYVLPNPNDYIFDGDYNDLFMSVEVTELAPSVEIAVSPASVAEGGAQGLIYSFTRSGPTDDPLVVFFSVGGTASAGVDYTGISSGVGTQTVTIQANESSANLVVFPMVDNEIESDETVSFTLLPAFTYGLGSTAMAVGTIEDDPPVVTVRLIQNGSEDLDADGTTTSPRPVKFLLTRTGGDITLPVTATFTVMGTGAHAADINDYVNEHSADVYESATVELPVNDDDEVEFREELTLYLDDSSSDFTVGDEAEAVAEISDNDFEITALAVAFLDLGVKRDSNGQVYGARQWDDTDGDGESDVHGENVSTPTFGYPINFPRSLFAPSAMEARAFIKIAYKDPNVLEGGFRVLGDADYPNGGSLFSGTTAVGAPVEQADGSSVVTVTGETESDTGLGDTIDRWNLQVSWTLERTVANDGDSATHSEAAGNSRNLLYVTGGVAPEAFETVLEIGCSGAAGLKQASFDDENEAASVAADRAVVDGVWSKFKEREVKRVDGTEMTYWATPNFDQTVADPARGYEQLLKVADGRCGEWADLFVATLDAQGIVSHRVGVKVIQTPAPADFPAADEVPPAGVDIAVGYAMDVNKAAQGTEAPWRYFPDHALVRIDGITGVYDPSYGGDPFLGATHEQDWEDAAISGFRILYKCIDPVTGAFRYDVGTGYVAKVPGVRNTTIEP